MYSQLKRVLIYEPNSSRTNEREYRVGDSYFHRHGGGSYSYDSGEQRVPLFERFMVGADEIQLRLDWSDLDGDGQPTLDADFVNPKTGEHCSLRGRRKDAHHTASSRGEGRRYDWEFGGFSKRFSVAVTWRASVTARAFAKMSCSAEIIRSSEFSSVGDEK